MAATALIGIGAAAADDAAATAAAMPVAYCGKCGVTDTTGDQRGSCDLSSGGCGAGGSCRGPSASALIGIVRNAAVAAASPPAERGFRGCRGEGGNLDSSRPFSSCSTSCACCGEGSRAVHCDCAPIHAAAARPPPGRAPVSRRSFDGRSCSITSQYNMQSLVSGMAVLSCLDLLDSYMPRHYLCVTPCTADAGAEVSWLFLHDKMQGV